MIISCCKYVFSCWNMTCWVMGRVVVLNLRFYGLLKINLVLSHTGDDHWEILRTQVLRDLFHNAWAFTIFAKNDCIQDIAFKLCLLLMYLISKFLLGMNYNVLYRKDAFYAYYNIYASIMHKQNIMWILYN